ncbi:MAG TPA: hypothetical protein VNV41_12685 [Candidatus Acidoferrales bacterium]|nr:hypothetical protein [Candidatus Acidoferrales bacterium]
MTDEKKVDPFKPQQPTIPGVLPSEGKAKTEPSASSEYPGAPQQKTPPPIKLIATLAVVALIILAGLLDWSRSSTPRPTRASADSTSAAPAPPAVAAKSAPSLPVGPGVIATTEELAKPWSAKRFLYRSLLKDETEPAMVVRLPRGEYWGFSLVEPFGNCELEFITDLDQLKTHYGFHADHPMVGDPCNHTVYDLLRYGGGASNDDLVRGLIVQGNGIRPPMAIEIRTNGKDVIAAREE